MCLTIFQGAYTGVCSAQHVPSYKNNIDKFKAKGVDHVVCVAVNDPYVLNGWAEKLEAKNAVSYSLVIFCAFKCVYCLSHVHFLYAYGEGVKKRR